jgi:hypothetical protein
LRRERVTHRALACGGGAPYSLRAAPFPLRAGPARAVAAELAPIVALVWFLLRDQGPHDYWRSGLVNTAWQRKPAFAVFKTLE